MESKKMIQMDLFTKQKQDCPGSPMVGNLPANAGDMGSIPGLGGFHMPWGNY